MRGTRETLRSLIRSFGSLLPAPGSTPGARREAIVVRPDHLGDVILSLPALRMLRQQAPEFRLTLLVGPWAADVCATTGVAHELLPFRFPGFDREYRSLPLAHYHRLADLAALLRRRAPLALLVLREDHWWGAWLGRAAGIPVRVGADHPAVRPFVTHAVPLRHQHAAARSLELVAAFLELVGVQPDQRSFTPATHPLWWPADPPARQSADHVMTSWAVRPPFAVIHPGSGAAAKCWPVERWAALVDAVSAVGLNVVLTGSAPERPFLETVARSTRSQPVILAGGLTLPVLAEVLRAATIVIGPDTGPLHLAVAVGTPTVHLFGPTDPQRFGPWGPVDRHRVVRAPFRCTRCGDLGGDRREGVGCMMALTVDAVAYEIERLLSTHLL